NAENNFAMEMETLKITTAYVDAGPTVKRIQPRAMGRAYTILKRSSHITVVVGEGAIRPVKQRAVRRRPQVRSAGEVGQKIHPIGFRIGVIRDWESKWFAEKTYAALLYEDHQIRTYMRKRLQNAALSHVEIERQANKVKVTLYTGKPGVIIGRGGKGVDDLKA